MRSVVIATVMALGTAVGVVLHGSSLPQPVLATPNPPAPSRPPAPSDTRVRAVESPPVTQPRSGRQTQSRPADYRTTLFPDERGAPRARPHRRASKMRFQRLASLSAEPLEAITRPARDNGGAFEIPDPVVPRAHPRDRWVLISKEYRAAYLFDGDREEARFPCAVGRGSLPDDADFTPTGWHRITSVVHNPEWNPSRRIRRECGLPLAGAIPPQDERNALGSVWMSLDGSSVGLHGTNDQARIGQAVTHGCVSFLNADAEEIARSVRVGTRVRIVEEWIP
jgi:lipoprotein-anchoring transpeptidase ErfK/SrfK